MSDNLVGDMYLNNDDGSVYTWDGTQWVLTADITGPAGAADTAEQVLAKLLTVDGGGSLLDADFLDGNDSSYFATQTDMTAVQAKNVVQDSRLTAVETKNTEQDGRLTSVEGVNTTQDSRLTAVEAKNSSQDTDIASKQSLSQKGHANGYASLDASAKVPASQLPAYVDDVLEFANLAAFPATGSVGVIYVALDTNKVYRWSGSVYTEISPSPGSTDAVPEGSVNLYFTNARASAAAPVQSVAGRTGAVVLTKSDVGLGNVDNTSDANKPISTATQTALNLKADKTYVDTQDALKAPLASPTFTGDPKAPTPATADNDTSIATTAYVKAQAYLTDAPSDGNTYGRKDGVWTEITGGGGTGVGGEWIYNSTNFAPPTSGQVRMNYVDPNQQLSTVMWISGETAPGVNAINSLMFNLKTGAQIYLQDKDNATQWHLFDVMADAVNHTTYVEVSVAWNQGSSQLVTNQRVELGIIPAGGGGGASVEISDTPPANPLPGTLWFESDSGNTYIWYDDGNSQQWVQMAGALPDNASPARTAETWNRIVNGGMVVTQETARDTGVTSGYIVDQWSFHQTSAGSPVASSNTSMIPDDPDVLATVRINTYTPADTSVAAGDFVMVRTGIEGNRVADFKWGTALAKPAVLRFTARATMAGTFCVAIRNWTGTIVSFVKKCVIAAETTTKYAFPIPACLIGTWPDDTSGSAALQITFTIMAGSNFHAPDGVWTTGSFLATSDITNWMATTSQSLNISNVGLYRDPDSTGVPPSWQATSYAEEFHLCQRYWQVANAVGNMFSGNVTSGGVYYASRPWVVPMRTTPAITATNGGNAAFPATVGSFNGNHLAWWEGRTANASAGGLFYSNIIANARF